MISPRIAEPQIMLLALDEDEAEKLNRPTAFPGPAQLRQRLGLPGNLSRHYRPAVKRNLGLGNRARVNRPTPVCQRDTILS